MNRVFRDKPGGLAVDYICLADQLKHALPNYTESGGTRLTKEMEAARVNIQLKRTQTEG